MLDNEGNLVKEELLDERVGIIDIGGGTVLIDTLMNLEFDKKHVNNIRPGQTISMNQSQVGSKITLVYIKLKSWFAQASMISSFLIDSLRIIS